MKMTSRPPVGEGYFWWTNFGEHTPTIMRVTRDWKSKNLYADNGEYNFEISEDPEVRTEPDDEDEEPVVNIDGVDYYHGSSFWSAAIELPEINGEFVKPDSY